MQGNINERIKHLEGVLNSLKVCTQPIQGHTDSGSIADCWNEVNDALASIKSMAKKNIYTTWITAIDSVRQENNLKYDDAAKILGTSNFHYLKEDNRNFEITSI